VSSANRLWGAPKIVGELHKIGIDVAKSTVERYMVRGPRRGSPTWKSFLRNHAQDLVSVDFFVVPTVRFRVLFVFLVLATDRRRVLHFNVTEQPTSEWTARQILQAFPWDTAPRFLLRDRDSIYGSTFRETVRNLEITEVLTAHQCPWQNPYVERLIGTIRRECLDHVIVLNEDHLRRVLTEYFGYYHGWRTHRSLDMDAPDFRPVQGRHLGEVIQMPEVGGLHHHYERRAA
jgi:transposase InsO family protein